MPAFCPWSGSRHWFSREVSCVMNDCSPIRILLWARLESLPPPVKRRPRTARPIYRRMDFALLKARVDPFLHVIESVLHRVGVLTRRGLARSAWPDTVGSALDDDVFLIGAGRDFVMNFVVA